MKRRITIRRNWSSVKKYEKLFKKRRQFPVLPRDYEKRIQPILHVGYLMFIRGKFLYLGMVKSLEEKNMYVYYSILKSFWEHVAACGYYYTKVLKLLEREEEEEAFLLALKMGLGGRGFPTDDMIKERGQEINNYKLPHIYTMMDYVDDDFKKKLRENDAILRDLYVSQIAEGGHTTYTGLVIAAKWTKDRESQIPDVNKKWNSDDKSSLINLAAMSGLIFFSYWNKFEEETKKYR
jgi:hypothetical protein